MNAPVRLVVALCVLAGATGLTACGSDDGTSEADYASSLDSIAASASAAVNDLSAKAKDVDSLPEAADLLHTFSDRTDELAGKVDDLDPPGAVADLQDQLVDLLHSLADKAQTAAGALDAGDILGLPAVAKIAGEAGEIAGQVESTVDQINEKLGLTGTATDAGGN